MSSGGRLSVAAYLAATALVTLVAGIPGGPMSPTLPAGAGPLLPFRWASTAIGLDRLSPSGQAALAAAAFTLALVAFLAVLLHAWRGRLPLPVLLMVGVGLHALVAALSALGSHDVALYAAQGRIAGLHHANPYVTVPATFTDDPLYPTVSSLWHPISPFYGPAFLHLAAALARIFRDPASLIASFKVIAAAASVGVMLLVAHLARRWMPQRAAFAVALFGWNPLVVFVSVGGAHNDLLLLLLAIGALAVLAGDDTSPGRASWREVVATCLLGLAALVKVPAALLLFLHVALSVARHPAERRGRALAIHASVLLALTALVAGPFLQPENLTLGAIRPWRFQTVLAPSVLVGGWASTVLGWVGVEGMSGLLSFAVGVTLLLIFLVLTIRLARRTQAASPSGVSAIEQGELWALGLLGLVLSAPLLQPWYLVLPLSLAWLLRSPMSWAVAAAAALASVTASIIPESVFEQSYGMVGTVLTRPIAAPSLLLLALCLAYYLDRRIGSPRAAGVRGKAAPRVVRSGRRSGPGHPHRPPAIRGRRP